MCMLRNETKDAKGNYSTHILKGCAHAAYSTCKHTTYEGRRREQW